MSPSLACIGEILIDFLPVEHAGQTTGFSMHPGGAPCNVAVGLARLGQPVAFVSKVSHDYFGRYLRTYVEAQGIDTRYLLSSDTAASTLAFVSVEQGEPVFTFYGEGTADTLLQADDLPAAFFDTTRLLHFGGISLLRGHTPATILHVVQQLKGHALLSFDPNMRPLLIQHETEYRSLLQQLFQLADLVKISAADMAWLSPGRSVEEVARELLAMGAALVTVTRGSAGVLALRACASGTIESWTVPAYTVPVVDTVGAGDAFSAGLLAALSRQGVVSRAALCDLPAGTLVECLRFAAAVAALTCTHAGASTPRYADVEHFLAQQGT